MKCLTKRLVSSLLFSNLLPPVLANHFLRFANQVERASHANKSVCRSLFEREMDGFFNRGLQCNHLRPGCIRDSMLLEGFHASGSGIIGLSENQTSRARKQNSSHLFQTFIPHSAKYKRDRLGDELIKIFPKSLRSSRIVRAIKQNPRRTTAKLKSSCMLCLFDPLDDCLARHFKSTFAQ